MELTKKQAEGLKIAIERFKNGERYTVISGYAGSGKAQPISTLIPTPEGYKKLGDIRAGDYVFDREGNETRVLEVFPQGKLDKYKVSFKDGRCAYCNDEHLWSYYSENKKHIRTKTLREMIDGGLRFPSNDEYKYRIPTVTQAINFYIDKPKNYIHPYLYAVHCMGGNDKIEDNVRIYANSLIEASPFTEFTDSQIAEWENYNLECYGVLPDKTSEEYKRLLSSYYTQEKLREAKAANKIDDVYKTASIEDRIAFIQGAFDVAAHYDRRNRLVFCHKSRQIIDDIQEILYSLGYKSTLSAERGKNNCYILLINVLSADAQHLFYYSSQIEKAYAKALTKEKPIDTSVPIVSIEKLEEQEEMVCIYVDNEEHLYLCNQYIVTHNTTLVNKIVECFKNDFDIEDDDIAFGTYTGKAAQVLIQKGNSNALTLHKMLFDYSIDVENESFTMKPKEAIDYKLVIVDEVSMVNKDFIDLMLSYNNVYYIFMGDPFQLPPIEKSNANGLLDSPHIFLDEIMRQAKESEIIRLSMALREKQPLASFIGKEVQVLEKEDLCDEMLTWADIAICAKNDTRGWLNQRIRYLLGFNSPNPQHGDKVICLKNYWDKLSTIREPLTNGTIGTVGLVENKTMYPLRNYIVRPFQVFETSFRSEMGYYKTIRLDKNLLLNGEKTLTFKEENSMQNRKNKNKIPLEFDFGYAITCWKAQGSQWDKVLLFEESFPFNKEEHYKYLYTGLTRAVSKAVIIKK